MQNDITVKELLAVVEERKASAITALAGLEGTELYRSQGDYRTLEWLLGLPEQIMAEREQGERTIRQDDGPDEY